MVFFLLLTAIFVGAFAPGPFDQRAAGSLSTALPHVYSFAGVQLTNTSSAVSKTSYPDYTTSSGSWGTSGASGWTSGFFPGLLWLMYQKTNDPVWLAKAQSWTAGLEGQKTNTGTHDVGFMMFSSFGNGYRLTNNQTYKAILLTAAGSLATRYSPTVKAIKSWNGTSTEFLVIIDNMMNLELLFWGAKNGGQQSWYDIAVAHAITTMNNHVRADGSVYQLVNFNPTNGAVQLKTNKQGYNSASTWSRGQAWAVHGFTIAYRETKDQRFLDTARRTADYYISHLPGDYIPYWDFQAPNIPNEPRDTSSAAITASGLLELSTLETDAARKQTYKTAAENILTSLSTTAYLAEGTNNKAVLLHGTGNKPSGNYDTGVIYGDYYFLQALLRYENNTGTNVPTITSSPPTGIPTVTSKPTSIVSPSPIVTKVVTSTPTTAVTSAFAFKVALHGIGNGGDNANPTASGTKDPLSKTKPVTIEIFNAANQAVKTVSGTIAYDNATGIYIGNIVTNVPGGIYTIRVTVERYLPKRPTGIITVINGKTAVIPQFSLISGDTNADGKLSVLDYNLILDCFSDLTPAKNCSDKVKMLMTDLTDDGDVNQFDYNLFLRELSEQAGQ